MPPSGTGIPCLLHPQGRKRSGLASRCGSDPGPPRRKIKPLDEHKRVSESPMFGASKAEKGRRAQEWLLKPNSSASSQKKPGSDCNSGLKYTSSSPQKAHRSPPFFGQNRHRKAGSCFVEKNSNALLELKQESNEEHSEDGVTPLLSTFSPEPTTKRSNASRSGSRCSRTGLVVAPDGKTMVKDRRNCKPRGVLIVRRENGDYSKIGDNVTEMPEPSIASVKWIVETSDSARSDIRSCDDALEVLGSCSVIGRNLNSRQEQFANSVGRNLNSRQEQFANSVGWSERDEPVDNEASIHVRSLAVFHRELVPGLGISNDMKDSPRGPACEFGFGNEIGLGKDSCVAQNLYMEESSSRMSSWLVTKTCFLSPDPQLECCEQNSSGKIGPNTPTPRECGWPCSSWTPSFPIGSAHLSIRRQILAELDNSHRYDYFDQLQSNDVEVGGSCVHRFASSSPDSRHEPHLTSYSLVTPENFVNHNTYHHCSHLLQNGDIDGKVAKDILKLQLDHEGAESCSPGHEEDARSSDCLADMVPTENLQSSASIFLSAYADDSPHHAQSENDKEGGPCCYGSQSSNFVHPLAQERVDKSYASPSNLLADITGDELDEAESENGDVELSEEFQNLEMELASQLMVAEILYELAVDNLIRSRTSARSRSISLVKEQSPMMSLSTHSMTKLPGTQIDTSRVESRSTGATSNTPPSVVSPETRSRIGQKTTGRAHPLKRMIRDTGELICFPIYEDDYSHKISAVQASERDLGEEAPNGDLVYSNWAFSQIGQLQSMEEANIYGRNKSISSHAHPQRRSLSKWFSNNQCAVFWSAFSSAVTVGLLTVSTVILTTVFAIIFQK